MLHVKLHLDYRDPLTADSAERGFCLSWSELVQEFSKILGLSQYLGPTGFGPWLPDSIMRTWPDWTIPDKNEQYYNQENCYQDCYNNENNHFFLFENKIYFCHFIFCLLSIEINFENWSKYKSLIWHPSPLLVPKYSITFIKTLIGCDEIASCYIYLNFDIWSVLAGSEISGCPDCSRLIGGYCPVQYPRNRFLSSLAKYCKSPV